MFLSSCRPIQAICSQPSQSERMLGYGLITIEVANESDDHYITVFDTRHVGLHTAKKVEFPDLALEGIST